MAWDESKHPRVPKGSPGGGEFTDGNGTQGSAHNEHVNKLIKWAKEKGVELPLFPDGSLDVARLERMKNQTLANKNSLPQKVNTMTKKEWALWYSAIGNIAKGEKYRISKQGVMIPIGNKLVITKGTFLKPQAKIIYEFNSEYEVEKYISKEKTR